MASDSKSDCMAYVYGCGGLTLITAKEIPRYISSISFALGVVRSDPKRIKYPRYIQALGVADAKVLGFERYKKYDVFFVCLLYQITRFVPFLFSRDGSNILDFIEEKELYIHLKNRYRTLILARQHELPSMFRSQDDWMELRSDLERGWLSRYLKRGVSNDLRKKLFKMKYLEMKRFEMKCSDPDIFSEYFGLDAEVC
jgi:hypothetical protein